MLHTLGEVRLLSRVNLRAGNKRQQRNRDTEEQICGGIFISAEDRDILLQRGSIHPS